MFDYDALDAETHELVWRHTREIRAHVRRPAADVVAIGRRLAEVKQHLGHDGFGQWVMSEFSWSQDAAWRFLLVAQQFGDAPQIAESAPSVLRVLVAPAAADSALLEALVRATAGERMTYGVLYNILDRHGALGLTVGELAEITGIVIVPAQGPRGTR